MQHVGASKLRRDFSRVYDRVAYGGERFIVDNHGKGLVALVPVSEVDGSTERDPRSAAQSPPRLDASIAVLRKERERLTAAGVKHVAIFGSLARGQARTDSDVDVLIEIDQASAFDLFDLAALQMLLTETLDRKVDLIGDALDPENGQHILKQAVYAF